MAENDVVEFQFSFSGEAFPLNDDGFEDWSRGKPINDTTVYYLSAKRRATLFRAAYSGIDELVKEMATTYNLARKEDGRLPRLEPAQIRRNIMVIQGTYYG